MFPLRLYVPKLVSTLKKWLTDFVRKDAFLGRLLGKTLWLHASSVSECVKLLVYTFCIIHIFLTQRRIRFICGVLMSYNVGNIMRVDMLGSKVIKGVLLDETLR